MVNGDYYFLLKRNTLPIIAFVCWIALLIPELHPNWTAAELVARQ